MNANEQLEMLKMAVEGGMVDIVMAHEEEVDAKIKHAYSPQTRRVTMDAQLTARPGQQIENFATAIGYRLENGDSALKMRSARGWGVTEGPQIAGGIDIMVLESGTFQAECTVGTFVKTDAGYKLWMKTEKFDIKA